MTEPIHPAASNHLPWFITAPGETDVLAVVLGVILVLFVLMIGNLYFRLHALPEQLAHKKIQFEIVCVLALLAMFTHMHIFWIAALLLALVDLPDFVTPLRRIARSTETIAGIQPGEGADGKSPDSSPAPRKVDEHGENLPPKGDGTSRQVAV